jgi:hypothetical protein
LFTAQSASSLLPPKYDEVIKNKVDDDLATLPPAYIVLQTNDK